MSTIFIKTMIIRLLSQLIRNVQQMLVRKFIHINTNRVLIQRLYIKSIINQGNRDSILLEKARVTLLTFLKERNKLQGHLIVSKPNLLIKNQEWMLQDPGVKWTISVVQVSVILIKIYWKVERNWVTKYQEFRVKLKNCKTRRRN